MLILGTNRYYTVWKKRKYKRREDESKEAAAGYK